MLKITDYNATDFTKGVSISEAEDIRVTHEVNGARTLDFTYPQNEKSKNITENKIVICEGQPYRIMKVSAVRDGRELLTVQCSHIWNADAPNIHIQNIPDMIGVSPTAVVRRAVSGTKFSLMSDTELTKLGMRRVDFDGFLIDFFSVDKTNPYDVVKAVIECCGRGELYADNLKIALVERIGKETNIRLDLTKNMSDMTVERDITDMVTRLYPYGSDDIHIGSVNSGVQYIKSPNAAVYGVRDGYRDYSDITKPAELYRRAIWEFDSANADRIDVPCVNITGTYADISKLAEYGETEKLGIGDSVTVIDGANEIMERVVKIEYYPYAPDSTVISVGRVRKDMFFYLEQMGILARRYKKVSTTGGKLKASSVSGTIRNTGVVSGNVTAQQITIGTNILTTDSEGNLLLNGERLIKETGENEYEQDI